MKYRVIEKKYSDGTIRFCPQWKGWIFWHHFFLDYGYQIYVKLDAPTYEEALQVIERDKKREARALQVAKTIHPVQ